MGRAGSRGPVGGHSAGRDSGATFTGGLLKPTHRRRGHVDGGHGEDGLAGSFATSSSGRKSMFVGGSVGHSRRRDGTNRIMQGFFGTDTGGLLQLTQRRRNHIDGGRGEVGLAGSFATSGSGRKSLLVGYSVRHSRRRDGTSSNTQAFFGIHQTICQISMSRAAAAELKKGGSAKVLNARDRPVMSIVFGRIAASVFMQMYPVQVNGMQVYFMRVFLRIVMQVCSRQVPHYTAGSRRIATRSSDVMHLFATSGSNSEFQRVLVGLVAIRGQGGVEHEVVPRVEAAEEGPVLE
ncbi:unnamed protein product [Prorocentrum cordatum]|uniref:Uncharacterized protein n=1 Tax=Prorocentrum cordatum TaxID=2364126 RepID=A0ABN9S828_9DINO|nr:unnamed protein product [Polarella glacialis]